MKSITVFLEDKFDDYEEKCAKHIINTLKDYIDFDAEPELVDKHYDDWVRFKSTIKLSDIDKIDKELRKVLASHETSVGQKGLKVNVFKQPLLSICDNDDDNGNCKVYLMNKTKTYYEKNIKK